LKKASGCSFVWRIGSYVHNHRDADATMHLSPRAFNNGWVGGGREAVGSGAEGGSERKSEAGSSCHFYEKSCLNS